MAKINLLPWRAERRKQRQQEFLTMLGVASAAAVLISLLIVLYYNGQIDGQNNRNQYLTDQISALDKQIVEIAELDKKKAGLLKRKQVIEELQASRSQMVHLFDELARTLPNGVYLSGIAQKDLAVTVTGVAQSNARVSAFMRNVEEAKWIGAPKLDVISSKIQDQRARSNDFTLLVIQADKDKDEAADSASGKADAATGNAAAPQSKEGGK